MTAVFTNTGPDEISFVQFSAALLPSDPSRRDITADFGSNRGGICAGDIGPAFTWSCARPISVDKIESVKGAV